MRKNAVSKRTQKSRRYNHYYLKMCREKEVEPIIKVGLALRMSRYIAWLYYQTNSKGVPLSAGVASNCVTQAGALWTEHGVSWLRKEHPQLRLQLDYYKRVRPSDRKIRKPICYPFFVKLIQPLLTNGSLKAMTLAAAMCIGYYFGARAGEYTCTKFTLSMDDIMLQHKHRTWSTQKARKSKVSPLSSRNPKSINLANGQKQ